MKIAFLGTPEFAIPSLEMLYQLGHSIHVFTQPDRPVGRHGTLTPPPVKTYALEHGIPVSQFEKIKSPEGVAALKAFAPDLMVTAAFGQILSAEDLSIPKIGCINVHGSLLPKYRGAAPIQWSVINGDAETGITTMFTDVGMDTGDMLLTDRVTILPNETAGELYERLGIIGAQTLQKTLTALDAGTLQRIPQNSEEATVCPMLKKEHGKLDFQWTRQKVHNRVRGTNPWPGAYALYDEEVLKIWSSSLEVPSDLPDDAEPGQCWGDGKTGLFVRCQDGWIALTELQSSGSKRLDSKTFLRGHSLTGKVLS